MDGWMDETAEKGTLLAEKELQMGASKRDRRYSWTYCKHLICTVKEI